MSQKPKKRRKLPPFGNGNADDAGYTMDLLYSWLESHVEEEASNVGDAPSNPHRSARLDRAYDALQALDEVMNWNAKLTKY